MSDVQAGASGLCAQQASWAVGIPCVPKGTTAGCSAAACARPDDAFAVLVHLTSQALLPWLRSGQPCDYTAPLGSLFHKVRQQASCLGFLSCVFFIILPGNTKGQR